MAKVKDQLAQLGMGTLVAGMKTVESTLSKKQYKRLIATAGSWHPSNGFHRNVDGTPPPSWGLKTCTGPRWAPPIEVKEYLSGKVEK